MVQASISALALAEVMKFDTMLPDSTVSDRGSVSTPNNLFMTSVCATAVAGHHQEGAGAREHNENTNKQKSAVEFEVGNDEEHEMEGIRDNTVYTKKSKGHPLGLSLSGAASASTVKRSYLDFHV